ncbi:MFS transporter [Neobacillus drentensis]|uniref:MFS transporter n=1 Tax=Neobacillus drentensis TaxID=220684 RepID=UPI00300033CE
MITMRIGFLFYLFTYLIMLVFHATLNKHILMLGISNGLAMSLYYVGMHLAVLDLTTNKDRDKFLYIEGILYTIGGIIAPLVSGIIISRFEGMVGYYVVFIATSVFIFLAFLVSLKVKGIEIAPKSHFWGVIRHPSPEWRKMYSIMFADGIVSGAFTTFLITMMTFKIAGGELNLGIYNTGAQIMSILAFYLLAKFTSAKDRIKIFAIGAITFLLSSALLSVQPVLLSLIIFGLISPISMNMLGTSMNAMIYESIEKDPHYKERRLDYIIIREIPLGAGRMVGVFLFLAMRNYFNIEELLPVSFSVFPVIYVLMVPILYYIWKQPKLMGKAGEN